MSRHPLPDLSPVRYFSMSRHPLPDLSPVRYFSMSRHPLPDLSPVRYFSMSRHPLPDLSPVRYSLHVFTLKVIQVLTREEPSFMRQPVIMASHSGHINGLSLMGVDGVS